MQVGCTGRRTVTLVLSLSPSPSPVCIRECVCVCVCSCVCVAIVSVDCAAPTGETRLPRPRLGEIETALSTTANRD